MFSQHANKVPSRRSNLGGFALVFVLAFAAVIMVFTATAGAQASYNLRLAEERGQTDRAFYAANAGTHLALAYLREPPAERDFDGNGESGSWLSEDASVEIGLPSSNADAFARVFHNVEGVEHASPAGPEPENVPIPKDCFYIVSVGRSGSAVYEQATMGTTFAPHYPNMPHAAFAFSSLTLKGGTIDHFNSQDDLPWTPVDNGNNPEASIATESTDESSIQLPGSPPEIFGNAFMGPGTATVELDAVAAKLGGVQWVEAPARPRTYAPTGTESITTPGPILAGRVATLPGEKVIPNMDYPDDQIEDEYTSLPSKLSLKEGKIYKVRGNLVVTGSSEIEVIDDDGDEQLGDAILLVEGNIVFHSGAKINENRAPHHLKIYSLWGTQFRMENGASAFCLVAGRDLTATLEQNSHLWGALLANNVTLEENSNIHFDVQLRDPIAFTRGLILSSSTTRTGSIIDPSSLGPAGPFQFPGDPPPPAPPPPQQPPPPGGCCGGCGGSMMLESKQALEAL